jgi:hypothetical protein
MSGDRDSVVGFEGMDRAIANLANDVPDCAAKSCSPAAAIGPSRSASEVNAAMIDFLDVSERRGLQTGSSDCGKRPLVAGQKSGFVAVGKSTSLPA